MIKVLIVAGTMNVGGIENQLMYLIRNVDKTKYSIDYTTTINHPYYQDEIEVLGGKCIHICSTNNGKNIIQYCKELYKIIKNGNYDVVHSNELFHSGIVLLVSKLAGVKCRIAHAHSCNQDYGRDVIRFLYNKIMRELILANVTDMLACSSMTAMFLFGNSYKNDSRYKIVVNSIDTKKCLLKTSIVNVGINKNKEWKNVIQIGRFSDEKNFLFTVDIVKEIKKRNLKIHFLFLGNNEETYGEKVRNKVKEYELDDYVSFLGIRDDVVDLLKQSDVFILPSKYEGMPLSLIEAQASCLPCVVADTFSHEVDFGIDAIQWISLDEEVDVWVNGILDAIHRGKSNKEDVINAINEKGFDSKEFTNKICKVYSDRINEN